MNMDDIIAVNRVAVRALAELSPEEQIETVKKIYNAHTSSLHVTAAMLDEVGSGFDLNDADRRLFETLEELLVESIKASTAVVNKIRPLLESK